MAIATGIARAKGVQRADGGFIPHFDDGGTVSAMTPGLAPTNTTMNPMYQSLVQRYAAMSPEQLREFVARAGASQQGQVAQRILQQKQMMAGSQPATPQQGQQQAQQKQSQIQNIPGVATIGTGQGPGLDPTALTLPSQQQQTTMWRGGVPHLAMGGSPMGLSSSAASPWWERSEARQMAYDDNSGGGFLHSSVAGRTDHIAANPPADSYVIPADVVSGLGEGNSMAGARMIQTAMGIGPWGTPLPAAHRGAGPPRPRAPALPREESRGGRAASMHGFAPHQGQERVPAMVAGGEFIVPPHVVAAIGRGDVRRGHRVLDHFVRQQRAKHIKTLKKLPGPVQ